MVLKLVSLRTIAIGALIAITASPSQANNETVENQIRARLTPLLNAPITSVVKSPFGEMFEVVTDNGLGYTDKNGSFFLYGATVLDTDTRENLTERREGELHRIAIADLPLEDAIKTVHGDGSRLLVTFEDPNCGYCRTLAPELDRVDNVTIYTFVMPVMAEDSPAKARAVWCAQDRSAAWRSLLETGAMPHSDECDTPLARNIALATKYRVRGTPTIVFADGIRRSRVMRAAEIETTLRKQAGL